MVLVFTLCLSNYTLSPRLNFELLIEESSRKQSAAFLCATWASHKLWESWVRVSWIYITRLSTVWLFETFVCSKNVQWVWYLMFVKNAIYPIEEWIELLYPNSTKYKTFTHLLVGNSANIEGTTPTFGLFTPFDRQSADDSLKRVYKRHSGLPSSVSKIWR